MSGILSLFNILTLFYLYRSVQLGRVLWSERVSIRQIPLTPRKKQLAEQAAFFIAVPISVFVHEFGHALAVWGAGGQVVQFGYRVFWGFVVPSGNFTPSQTWFIALAGTLGSLFFGWATWLLLRNNASPALRYFGLRAFRFQVFFSLVYYPVFTLLGFEGDWKTIYDFASTSVLSGVTAVAHAIFLATFTIGDRRGWFEAIAHKSEAAITQLEALMTQANLQPDNADTQLQIIDAYRQGGADNKARTRLQKFLKQNPQNGAAYLQMAMLQSDGKPNVSRQVRENIQKAISLGLTNPSQVAYANQMMGRYYLDVGKGAEAVDSFGKALAAIAPPSGSINTTDVQNLTYIAQLHAQRSRAYRRQKQYQLASQDLQKAATLAQQVDNKQLVARYKDEQTILEKQAGQKLPNEELPI